MNEKANSLKKASDAFALWRGTRQGKGQIPEELFLLAAEALKHFGLTYVAKELGLNRTRLAQGVSEVGCLSVGPKNLRTAATAVVVPPGDVLHFSRMEQPVSHGNFAPIEVKQNPEKQVHAQLNLRNGNVLSFCSLESVRILCQEASRQGGG